LAGALAAADSHLRRDVIGHRKTSEQQRTQGLQ
jgi:hypothetical protein